MKSVMYPRVLAGRTSPEIIGMVYAVAEVNMRDDETPFDWAAYIGAVSDEGAEESQRIEAVASNGDKLPREVAEALWPGIKEAGYGWRYE